MAATLVDAALAALDRNSQLDEARRLVRRRLPGLTRAAPEKAASRLRDYLLRRGFAGGVVSEIVRESLRVRLEAD